jgi:DNA primase
LNYEIVQILDSILGPGKAFAKGEFYYFCPFCHHYNPKLAVNVNKGKWQCWKCNARGGKLLSLLRKLDVSQDQIRKLQEILKDEVPHVQKDEVVTNLTLPKEFLPLWENHKSLSYLNAMKYLERRRLTVEDIIRFQVGYCEEGMYAQRIIVPSFDASGSLNFFVGRRYLDGGLNYLNPPISKNIIPFDSFTNWSHPIVLVEGMFDAMAVKRNGIPLIGKHVPAKLQEKIIKERVKDIYLALDDDALAATVKIAEKFMREGLNVHVVELSGKDPSKIGASQMNKLIKQAKKLSFSDLINLKMR